MHLKLAQADILSVLFRDHAVRTTALVILSFTLKQHEHKKNTNKRNQKCHSGC